MLLIVVFIVAVQIFLTKYFIITNIETYMSTKVIRGWDLGVLTMTKGEGSRFTLAPDMGYGPGGFPAWGIPPNATLVFDIEVLRINGA